MDASISGVNFVMIAEITGWDVSKISAQTSWSDVLTHVPACDYNGLSEGKAFRASGSLIPRFIELLFNAQYEFVELLGVES